jgi:hypothetical protein
MSRWVSRRKVAELYPPNTSNYEVFIQKIIYKISQTVLGTNLGKEISSCKKIETTIELLFVVPLFRFCCLLSLIFCPLSALLFGLHAGCSFYFDLSSDTLSSDTL